MFFRVPLTTVNRIPALGTNTKIMYAFFVDFDQLPLTVINDVRKSVAFLYIAFVE